jgi:hypothetical protein
LPRTAFPPATISSNHIPKLSDRTVSR